MTSRLDEIDLAIGALTNHVRTVVEESEREVPASSDRRKFPPDILELIRAKTQLCAARAHIPLPSTDPERELSNAKAIDDAEIAECLADSIETQCSHASLRDIAHISRIEEEEAEVIGIHKPGNHATSCQLQTDQPPERSGQTIRKILKTRLSDHLLGKGLIIDEQFGFRPAILVHSKSSA
ncbi:hypothetical protein EVAR_9531_1 [Eumeta japonica]|uniref:Uncharacterized protein n=1 Tax=Eumeta variegata TaxID=151549 RepID=A0A4C1U403_EUMVA|nr:hypothetical protein EVAR_9531_1 [Eumeta japonica]